MLNRLKRRWPWFVVGVPLALILLAVGGTYVYINFIKDDAPARLDFADATASDGAAAPTTSASPSGNGAGGSGSVEGTWAVTAGSQAGYRVNEVLFGQDTEAVGRTADVTGSLTVSGTTVADAEFTVDLTTVESDESRRDNQFRGRIMNTDEFPQTTFTLTSPIEFGTIPDDQVEVTHQTTGELTLRGTTKEVTFDLTARRNGGTIEVKGTIPIVFADYGIPEPSFGPATVEDHGEIEFLLVLTQGTG